MKQNKNISVEELAIYLLQFDIKLNSKNTLLYFEAFTHNSYANEQKINYSYQRLEFLGDAILSKEISLYLYKTYPKKQEGEITSYRSIIVRKDTLAVISSHLKLGRNILLGHGEIKTKGYEKDNILADVLEAFIAAMYLDRGEKFTRNFIKKNIIAFVLKHNYFTNVLDYKTQLQEVLQSDNKTNPKYKVISEKWENNKTLINKKIIYNVVVMVDDLPYGTGEGYSIKEAEQNAAKSALLKLSKNIKT